MEEWGELAVLNLCYILMFVHQTGLNTHCISLSYWKPAVAMGITVWSLHFLAIQLLNNVCKSDLKKKKGNKFR